MKTKNRIQEYLLVIILLVQGNILFSQGPFIQALFDPNSYNGDQTLLYFSDNSSSISVREKSDLKISVDRKIKMSSNDFEDYYNYYYSSYYLPPSWEGEVSSMKLAYSPISHLYGTASLIWAKENEQRGWFSTKANMVDVGIGGYILKERKDVIKKKNIFNRTSNWMMPQRGLLLNALVGYSRGKIIHEGIYNDGKGIFALNRFYGQFGVDYQARIWGVASTLKLGMINYSKPNINEKAATNLRRQTELIMKANNYAFSELTVRFYLGMKFGQVYISGVKTNSNSELNEFVSPGYWNAGVVLDVQEIFKKRNKE